MKIVAILGIVLLLFGGLLFLVGVVVCANTWTSDYATSTCKKAEEDRTKFDAAKELCGNTTSDCYRQATIGLTSADECEARTEYMNRQMLMGIVPAVLGGLLAFVGFCMALGGFLLGRRKRAAAAA